MPLDDDDDPTSGGPPPHAAEGSGAKQPQETAGEVEEDDEERYMQQFLSVFDRRGIASQAIKRGEKDFESHGTRAQENLLEASRQVLEEVLDETRFQKESSWIRGWYFPNYWADAPCDTELQDLSSSDKTEGRKRGVLARERVVVVDNPNNNLFKTLGRVVTGLEKGHPSTGKLWLLPEEALFLVDRGTLDLWYPAKLFEELFPSDQPDKVPGGIDDYECGFPLTQEAAYSLLIGGPEDRGKITPERFQVFANLNRTGYTVLRAPENYVVPKPQAREEPPQKGARGICGLWKWMVSLISSPRRTSYVAPSSSVPLVQPGLYRDYRTMYQKIAVIPRYSPAINVPCKTENPYKVFYLLWKAGGSERRFSKTAPPQPDFYLAVVDARVTPMPTLGQVSNLLKATPWSPPPEDKSLYPRLKHGYRQVLVAVVDQGIINYYRFSDGAFGEELLFPRFDTPPSTGRGLKTSRRGKGGRGRGRGGRRGGKR